MSSQFEKVGEFVKQSGFNLSHTPPHRLGAANIEEEYRELRESSTPIDWIDAMADLIYVVHFAAQIWNLSDPSRLPPDTTPPNEDEIASASRWMNTPNALLADSPTPAQLHYRLHTIYLFIYTYEITASPYLFVTPNLIDLAFNLVQESNMTKFPLTEETAQRTVSNYKSLFALGKSPYDTPNLRKIGEKYTIYNESTGKVLKSIDYRDAHTLFKHHPIMSMWLTDNTHTA